MSADLFKVNNFLYIVIADYYSKFPFVKKLNNLTATTVVNVVRSIFSEQGIPETLICDNGTQFTSSQFQDLAKKYGFRVVTSSQYYPKGHGFIERQVQTVKKILLKCKESGTDPSLVLLSLRSTPLSATLKSPAELNGRMFKTTLPAKIHPPNSRHETRDLLLTQQKKQVNLYNRDSKEKPNLFQNQAVQVQDPLKKTWSPARVVEFGPTPRSYITEDESGVQIRRNRQLIKPDIQTIRRYLDQIIGKTRKSAFYVPYSVARQCHRSQCIIASQSTRISQSNRLLYHTYIIKIYK